MSGAVIQRIQGMGGKMGNRFLQASRDLQRRAAYGERANEAKLDVLAERFRVNDLLPKDAWEMLDDEVINVARKSLNGVADLISNGLVLDVPNPFGTTVIEQQRVSDLGPASVSMDMGTQGDKDAVEFDLIGIPNPVIRKDARFGAREMAAAELKGMPLDPTYVAIATQIVAETAEGILFNGSSVKAGGYTIDGYTTHPARSTGSITTAHWATASADGAEILADVLAMRKASRDANHNGPWILYVADKHDSALSSEYSTSYPKSIYDRLREIDGIMDVKPTRELTDSVVLVEMSRQTVDWADGFQPTVVDWEAPDGSALYLAVMMIGTPRIKSDQNDNSGIVHFTEA